MFAEILLAETPVPRDIPLPLPLDEVSLKAWIISAFLFHILFVNLMVGGTILTCVYEFIGRRYPRYDALAEKIAGTVTVNKSIAVVLGVGPLLMISLAYTMQWYTANTMTAYAWISIIPLVTTAFLVTYLHKYTWQRWNSGGMKSLHLALGVVSVSLFLTIAMIFLANVNLMHFPNRWQDVHGFFSAFLIGNGSALARYFHFLAASVAISSLFLCLWLTRSPSVREQLPEGFSAPGIRRHFYRITFFVTLAQLVIGPTLLLVVPHVGISVIMLCAILGGATVAAVMLYILHREIQAPDSLIGRRWHIVALLLFVVALSMGSGRQFYREVALVDHQWEVQKRTDEFLARSDLAYARHRAGFGSEMSGKELFTITCSSCHQRDKAISAPTLKEIAELYSGRPEGIVTWAKAPGKKRQQFSQMPPFSHVGNEQLKLIADYMLEVGAEKKPEEGGE